MAAQRRVVSRRALAARKKDFARLIERGLIRSEGGGRSIYYVLSDGAVQVSVPETPQRGHA